MIGLLAFIVGGCAGFVIFSLMGVTVVSVVLMIGAAILIGTLIAGVLS